MHVSGSPKAHLTHRRQAGLWLLLFWSLFAGVMDSPSASAHAALERAEPSVGGLVIAPPREIRLFFTEVVAAANPTPSIQVLNEAGEPQDVEVRPLGANGDPRTVTAEVESLDEGTYTVVWSVRSITDGHTLSGTYAFRVGGGIPPGVATTEGETPAPWAVATRWITFLGIAIAGAGFLFGRVVLRDVGHRASYARRRVWFTLGGAVVALLASLAEPVLQTLFPPENIELDLGSAINGLPAAWWFRPVCLGIAVLLGVLLVSPSRDRTPSTLDWAGAAISLLALAGLSLTSHAAGQETWRGAAVASNVLHQLAVALWIGGLLHLALWWPSRGAGTGEAVTCAPLRRFSVLALPLVVIALATGLVNSGFMFPLAEGLEEYGVTPKAFATLWTTAYGYALIVKLLVLIVPLGLAIYHRATIIRAAHAAAPHLGARISRTIRLEALAVVAVVLGGSAMALSAPPVLESAPLEQLILTAPVYTADGTMTGVVHLEIDPAKPGANALTLRVTDTDGTPLPPAPTPRITLDFMSLNHGTVDGGRDVQPVEGEAATFTTGGLELSLNGWWSITTTIQRQGHDDAEARIYLLLPDPNLQGFDAPADAETSPEARALFDAALQTMTSWSSVHVRERITSASDALVIVERTIATGTNDQPPAQIINGIYAAGFGPTASGASPAAPRSDFHYIVTIGDEGWQRLPDGTWIETSPSSAQPPSEWGSMYAGAENIRLGATEEINGELAQIITLHAEPSDAWFAWWVGIESGTVYRTAMVARQHYMVWEYSGMDEPLVIERPPI